MSSPDQPAGPADGSRPRAPRPTWSRVTKPRPARPAPARTSAGAAVHEPPAAVGHLQLPVHGQSLSAAVAAPDDGPPVVLLHRLRRW